MIAEFDPYRILGVRPGVSQEQLRVSQRQKARFAHPDFGGSHQKLAEVQTAFEVLSEPRWQSAFDRHRANPAVPEAAAAWSAAYREAQIAAAGRQAGDRSEVEQMADQMYKSRGARAVAGGIIGALVGGGAGALTGSYVQVGGVVSGAIGGAIGLIAGAWTGAMSRT